MEYYVYVICREDGSPFYVGKGSGSRIASHIREAKRAKGVNRYKDRIISKMIKEGKEPIFLLDSRYDDEKQAYAREIELIAEIGRHDLNKGPLTNRSDGGGGSTGVIWTETKRARAAELLRAKWKDTEYRAAHANLIRELLLNNGSIEERRSAAHAAKLKDPVHLERIANLAREQWKNDEFHKKQAERNRLVGRDPDNLKINRTKALERWASGKYDACKKRVMVSGIVYESMSEAAVAIGVSINTLSARFCRYAKKGVFPEGYAYVDHDWDVFSRKRAL